MSDFVKELNFDGDTFNDMKRDMNFVLQRLLGNMQEKECQEGTLTLKLDVSLVREYVPNYNPMMRWPVLESGCRRRLMWKPERLLLIRRSAQHTKSRKKSRVSSRVETQR